MAQDQLLSDTTPAAPQEAPETTLSDDIAEVAPDTTAEDFDLLAFAKGMRPNRAKVTLTFKAHLVPVMQDLVDKITAADARGEDFTDLLAEYERVREDFDAHRKDIVVEARSTDWTNELKRQAKKQGLDLSKPDDLLTITLRSVAGHIVSPTKGVGPDAVRAIYEANEVEYQKLLEAVARVDNAAAQAPVVPGFSLKSSTRNRSS